MMFVMIGTAIGPQSASNYVLLVRFSFGIPWNIVLGLAMKIVPLSSRHIDAAIYTLSKWLWRPKNKGRLQDVLKSVVDWKEKATEVKLGFDGR
ncbi:general substrate transporter [Penicillium maclennaniae]|uniref:general substrate transporter n=1 Tax=Penicillium maclennaniae TaxID=1343394 RepID=UPI00253F9079|nr:general substrate transporter [Penicillium maclennaniae]KAJ5668468.1 general substrate transporter [Penicillium maclennaniae]